MSNKNSKQVENLSVNNASTETKKAFNEMSDSDKETFFKNSLSELNDKLRAMQCAEISPEKASRPAYSSGLPVGGKFKLTGVVAPQKVEKSVNSYLAAQTTTGEWVSLKALIPCIYSGYSSKETDEFIDEININNILVSESHNPTCHKTERELKAISNKNAVILNHGVKSVFQLYALINANLWSCANLEFTFEGAVYRQTIAKKGYLFGEGEVQKGYKRSMKLNVYAF